MLPMTFGASIAAEAAAAGFVKAGTTDGSPQAAQRMPRSI
jgi:hypothetical protein